MQIVMFYHSLLSDWNHGNAHFLRGIASELLHRGHDVRIYEPRNAWSFRNLRLEHGTDPIRQFRKAYPGLKSIRYNPQSLDVASTLADVDLAIVHEWSDPTLVKAIGDHRSRTTGLRLLFHDTHHRAVTNPSAMAAYDLSHYDGVLAFGNVLRNLYLKRRWPRRAWTWHEAADTRVFRPIADRPCQGDLVWIGNWGDDERTAELQEFLIEPVKSLRLKARIHGVRYPRQALASLKQAGIEYAGWLPNFAAPEIFSHFRMTVHVPRRPYVQSLVGIPTIRVFEALACGIPLICAPWHDVEHLFTPGSDYLVAQDGREMKQYLRLLLNEPELAHAMALRGHQTVLSRHTCAHRVDELLTIYAELTSESSRHHRNGQLHAQVPNARKPHRRLIAS
ncbi:MAG: glycosyltransferase [Bacillota bacterium]